MHTVKTDKDWSHLHHIRRTVLFASVRQPVEYDENHPDDREPGDVPYLLILEDRAVGVVRIDYWENIAVVRLVVIVESDQGKGHGRQLKALIEAEAKKHGVVTLRVNAAPGAVGYYEKKGWRHATWNVSELISLAKYCVQITKVL
ncbi:GNAT superfamily N-acetyltransferase [Labrenzia sp. EL_126]|nr:GNAT superfamily N-acetyltransferase [Labrenzia sp. EL_126]